MAGAEDWLMRPVLRGMCKYTDLRDGSISLYDVALMTEALDVEEENRRRINDSNKAK